MKKIITIALAFILAASLSAGLCSCDEKSRKPTGDTTDDKTTTAADTTVDDTTIDPTATTSPETSTTKAETTVPETTQPHVHTDGEWIVDKEPTSKDEGKRHQICAGCGATLKEESIPATGSLEYIVNSDGKTCTVTGIGTYALPNLVIDEYIDGYKVTVIGEFAFSGAAKISAVTIPKSVTRIERYAFFECTALKTVNYDGTDAEWDLIEILPKNDGLTKVKPGKTAVFCDYVSKCFGVLGQFSSPNDLNGWDIFNLGEVKPYKEYYDRIYNEDYEEWLEDVTVRVYKVSELDRYSMSLFGQTYDYSNIHAQAKESNEPTFDYSYDAEMKEIFEYVYGGWGGAEDQYTFEYDNFSEVEKGKFEINYHYVEQIWSDEDYEVIDRIDTDIKGKIVVELVDGNYLMRSHTVTYPAE